MRRISNHYIAPIIISYGKSSLVIRPGSSYTFDTRQVDEVVVKAGDGRPLKHLSLKQSKEHIRLGLITVEKPCRAYTTTFLPDNTTQHTTSGYLCDLTIENTTLIPVRLTSDGVNSIDIPPMSFIVYYGRDGYGVSPGIILKDFDYRYASITIGKNWEKISLG